MTKENFVKIIKQLEAGERLQQKVASAIQEHNEITGLYYPEEYGLVISHDMLVIELLEEIMEDKYWDISHFCYELDFGKDSTYGEYEDADGNEIEMDSAEKLYDYLMSKKGE